MERLIILLFLFTVTLSGFAQSLFKGFFKPVDESLFKVAETTDQIAKADQSTSIWLFRPIVTITAMQFTFDKPMAVSSLSSMGTGLSYSHFISQNDQPYQNFSANLLILFTQDVGDVEPAKLSIAGTVSVLQYISVGVGYSFGNKKAFLLTGVAYNFN
jgi:hypothetical protein